MKRGQQNNTATDPAATQIIGGAPALSLDLEDAEQLRAWLRHICRVAGSEAASEDALDTCGRYADRALELLNRNAAPAAGARSAEDSPAS